MISVTRLAKPDHIERLVIVLVVHLNLLFSAVSAWLRHKIASLPFALGSHTSAVGYLSGYRVRYEHMRLWLVTGALVGCAAWVAAKGAASRFVRLTSAFVAIWHLEPRSNYLSGLWFKNGVLVNG